jgi:fumarate reductase subunit D
MEEETKLKESKEEKKEQTNVMAIISYIGALCLIPLLIGTKDDFVKFHAKQGLVLFAGEVITWIVIGLIPFLWFLGNILGVCWLVLSIIGIINVANKRKKEIPFVGKFADKIKF